MDRLVPAADVVGCARVEPGLADRDQVRTLVGEETRRPERRPAVPAREREVTRVVQRDGSRRRRGYDVDIPRRRVARDGKISARPPVHHLRVARAVRHVSSRERRASRVVVRASVELVPVGRDRTSTSQPRRDSSPRNIPVAAAAPPRLVATEDPRRGRGAATRHHGISTSRPRRRRDSSESYPRGKRTATARRARRSCSRGATCAVTDHSA